ncbi:MULTISPECIES: aldo/keto reductase [unclassified Acinetobacter]|uniref:aldo/keto reductase n=1 Tax=unclassified Acinetobacter TaxID=196816 RepID=UPI0015D239D5|nr:MULTISPECIES: aldo/keto reductase [unclassified Acinetobacter]
MKLGLGTVQFGLSYGVANASGQVSLTEVKNILALAHTVGIRTLDTAIAYGNSEACLGQAGVEQFNIVSKLPPLPENVDVNEWVETQIQASLQRLNLKQLDALLLHRSLDIVESQGVVLQQALQHAVDRGWLKAVGISIYNPVELEQIIPIWKPDLIQSPLNIFDQRLIQSGWLQKLNELGIRVHTRSVFLQGLLLMPEENIPAYFQPWTKYLSAWHKWCNEKNIEPIAAAIAFLNGITEVENIIVGVDSEAQLQQIVESARVQIDTDWQHWAISDKALIEPSRWQLNK